MSQASGLFKGQQDRLVAGVSVALRTNFDGLTLPPVNGSGIVAGSPPHVVMSPIAPGGVPTMGAVFSIDLPLGGVVSAASPVASGFVVTVWWRNPITYVWKKMAPVTFATAGVSDTDVCFVTEDLDASELYFQVAAASVAADGFIRFCLVEI